MSSELKEGERVYGVFFDELIPHVIPGKVVKTGKKRFRLEVECKYGLCEIDYFAKSIRSAVYKAFHFNFLDYWCRYQNKKVDDDLLYRTVKKTIALKRLMSKLVRHHLA